MPTSTDYRIQLDRLADSLQQTVLTPIAAVWTPALSGAAKSVTDVAPDKLAARSTSLLAAFAAYRPYVESTPPARNRTQAVAAVDDAVAALKAETESTTRSLTAAKEFKTTSEKATIEGARSKLDTAIVALAEWKGAFHLFDESVTDGGGGGGGGGGGSVLTTWTTLVNGTPYDMTVAVTVADDRDWASSVFRPDRMFSGSNGAPLAIGRFSERRKRSDVNVAATSARFTVTAKILVPTDSIDGAAATTLEVKFTLDQAAVRDTSGSARTSGAGEPTAPFFEYVVITGSGASTHIARQTVTERPDRALELIATIANLRGD